MTLLLIFSLCLAIFCHQPASAVTESFVSLPAGHRVVEFGWHNSSSVIAISEFEGSFSAWRIDSQTAQLSRLVVQPQFERIREDSGDEYTLEFSLAPGCTAMAVLQRYENPLRTNDLSVFRVDADNLSWLTTRSIPATFSPEHMAWDGSGEFLFLSTSPYLFSEQTLSVGRYSVSGKDFQGLVRKSVVDNIDDMEVIGDGSQLAIVCRGLNGMYPTAPCLALLDLATGKTELLNGNAAETLLHAVGNGEVLVIHSGTDSLQIVEAATRKLRSTQIADDLIAVSVSASKDGRVLAFLKGQSLVVRHDEKEAEFESDFVCNSYRLSSDGLGVCAVTGNDDVLALFPVALTEL